MAMQGWLTIDTNVKYLLTLLRKGFNKAAFSVTMAIVGGGYAGSILNFYKTINPSSGVE